MLSIKAIIHLTKATNQHAEEQIFSTIHSCNDFVFFMSVSSQLKSNINSAFKESLPAKRSAIFFY